MARTSTPPIKDIVYIVTIIGGFITHYFTLKQMIQDEITQRLAKNEIIQFQIDNHETRLNKLESSKSPVSEKKSSQHHITAQAIITDPLNHKKKTLHILLS
jgi:hypothetical protein